MNLHTTLRLYATADRFWIGVDFDGTLAHHEGGLELGKPIPPMLKRVKDWLAEGQSVKIFTARAGDPVQKKRVAEWCRDHGLGEITITNKKDQWMTELWDDKAVAVEKNTGKEL